MIYVKSQDSFSKIDIYGSFFEREIYDRYTVFYYSVPLLLRNSFILCGAQFEGFLKIKKLILRV